ncbi:MAG: HlyD family efflux transporter periplasmic adaptor subunit [Balneolaceae bacterium]|nr:HlyD family efflux transporter periplasmic adaptor subunit [Balneolaceae bacterium]
MERRIVIAAVIVIYLAVSACSTDEKSDAYGQFEATEITVASEVGGRLVEFAVEEGLTFRAGEKVGMVDTTMLALREKELRSQLEAVKARLVQIDAQKEVLKERLATARKDLQRFRDMIEQEAATPQQVDNLEGQVRGLRKEIDALQTQKLSVQAEINTFRSRIDQIREQIDDAVIYNPVDGTVLTTFAENRELVGTGQPLYRLADLDTLELRVYISGAQLPAVRLGQNVEVLADKNAKEMQTFTGRISWIASEAEFTPKMIQTKEVRVTQVYAVKVRVPNRQGILKIGMPGEVNFKTEN